MAKLLERLQEGILIADGAMGTLLYRNGLDNCYEAYNFQKPEDIKTIHKAYIKAGADIIQTNTYGAKRHKLKGYGLEDHFEEINIAGARIAREAAGSEIFVLGTIGASRGIRQCDLSLDEIVSETVEQTKVLLSTQLLDGLLFETYYDTEEIFAVLEAIRPLTDLPIITNISLQEVGLTARGQSITEVFSHLVLLGADLIGLNCHQGPYHMIQSLKQVPLFAHSYLSVYPNASLLALDTGDEFDYQFSSNAEYFGQSVVAMVNEGARLIGGCCGTTPDHIKAVKRAVRGLSPITKKQIKPIVSSAEIIPEDQDGERLVDKVKRDITVIAELDPPKTLDISSFKKGIRALDATSLDAITLADNSLAKTRICNVSLAAMMKEEIDTPFLLHLTCRDHNLIGLQSRLLGMDILGINHILAITGDPSKLGDFPGATSVYDVNSFKLIELIKDLNKGQSYSGTSLKKATHFTIGAAFNPNIKNLSRSGRLIEKKIEAGADYFLTQPIFKAELIPELYQLTKSYEQPFFVGIMPITSYNNAVFLHNEVRGIDLSEEFLQALEAVKDDKEQCQAIALAESKRLIDEALNYFNGIYLITPFMRYDLTVELINYVEKMKQKRISDSLISNAI
ncbi:bifunctional homocysteine S-methyltransferase/methylenetetrahydrofolate reductase [Streptococcus ictaluri]|uniref:Bifunctional homocysteine S-methyltransferase/5,10-methylenetetrahydrofolate reductase protein n=1 Tax=Streptococcus ictaluri 707-05 TaxID=764299 RepID=G5K349_9STRE|nr:bifunctional homocysteine S-methyltransferase/methylenetetrahydrofolate reductase [Streptococcus ictaluri]EHI69449.1 bifunctional homocysteine S-methyltransferase/5,10-methylenetetrahydrofolate reductase protein [Streptococcus ictaluri 707-05]